MKAVIPAAGLGTRFLPASKAQPKEMIPLVDKPAIQYVVEEAVRAGITDIILITGRGKGSLEDHFDRNPELEAELERGGKHELLAEMRRIADLAEIHTVRQGQPKGLGHAVWMARQHVGDEPFAVMLGDDIMHERSTVLSDMVAAHERTGGSVIALKKVAQSEISSYGCAAIEPVSGEPDLVKLIDVVEKPDAKDAPSDLAVMGRYVFTPSILDLLEKVEPGKGGEIQLTDAIRLLMNEGTVYGFPFTWGRFDAGNKLDYLRATVELALERDDLGPPFRQFLAELAERENLR